MRRVLTIGCITESRYLEISSVEQLQAETMGRPGLLTLKLWMVNLRQDINMRSSGSGVDEVTDSLRKAAVRNKRIGLF